MNAGRILIVALFLVPLITVAGCRGERSDAPPREFFPSLDDQQKWKPQGETDFYADGRTSRRPVAGTVAFGHSTDPADPTRGAMLRDSDGVYRGVGADGGYLALAPVEELVAGAVTTQAVADLIARGRDRYDIYCLSCHGGTGAGDGVVGKRWSYPLPNFHDVQYQPGGEKGLDGYLFHTIRNGVPNVAGQLPALRMPAYAERVSERDAWAIVLYMRALQRSRSGSLDAVPDAERQRLLQTRGATSAAPTTRPTEETPS